MSTVKTVIQESLRAMGNGWLTKVIAFVGMAFLSVYTLSAEIVSGTLHFSCEGGTKVTETYTGSVSGGLSMSNNSASRPSWITSGIGSSWKSSGGTYSYSCSATVAANTSSEARSWTFVQKINDTLSFSILIEQEAASSEPTPACDFGFPSYSELQSFGWDTAVVTYSADDADDYAHYNKTDYFDIGETVYVKFVFKNSGKTSIAAMPFKIEVFNEDMNSVASDMGEFPGAIPAGSTPVKYGMPLTLSKAGEYLIKVTLDPDNTLEDDKATDNSSQFWFSYGKHSGESVVSFDGNGGTSSVASMNVETGTAITSLPTATRSDYVFLGWFTAADGGTQVSSGMKIKADVTFYAHWEKEVVPYIAPDPDEDDPMDVGIANTYDGMIVDADGLPIGYINVKTTKAAGKGETKTSKVTVTIQMAGETKKVTIKGSVDVSTAEFSKAASDGRVLELMFTRNTICGTFDDYEIDGVRNLLSATAKTADAKAEKAAATEIANKFKGNYVMAYSDENGWNGLSVQVMAKGKVKVSGTLANGTKVSTTSQLIVGEDYCCIPVIYTKTGTSIAFSIYCDNESGEMSVFGYYDAVISPVSNLDDGLGFNIGEEIYDLLADYELAEDFLPYGVEVEASGTKWKVAGGAKAGKIKVVDGEIVDTKESDNPSGLKLTYTAKTGIFKGSFKIHGLTAAGKLKTFTATVSGIVVDGCGYGTAKIAKFGNVPITIE